jgi:hypothetical protein
MNLKWMENLKNDPLPWLLEDDQENPGIRFFTLQDLLDYPPDAQEVKEARQAIMSVGPVPIILAAQEPQGYWVEPGPGYSPKYRGTIWQMIFLAQLGADGPDPRVQLGCEYVLDHSRSHDDGFSADGHPSGMIHCLQGNLAAALIDLGYLRDERLAHALDWLARSITGEGIAPAEEKDAPVRYYRSGNSAPGFACSANNHLPCAWGAVKALSALSKVPEPDRTPGIRQAIETGKAFLLSHDPSLADYPTGYSEKPSRSWFQLGLPTGYVTDFLQILEVLAALGLREDPSLQPAFDLLLGKQDMHGRWCMEYTYNRKTWVDIEKKGQPSKWVTLRVLRVLRA